MKIFATNPSSLLRSCQVWRTLLVVSLSPTLSFSLSLSHTHTHTHTLMDTQTRSPTRTSDAQTYTHSPILTDSHGHTVTLTHTYSSILTHSHGRTITHMCSHATRKHSHSFEYLECFNRVPSFHLSWSSSSF